MKLYIAGGCNEHGRNCFYLEDAKTAIMIDCGRLGGTANELPLLSKEQIQKTDFLFLTHSHADHVGALSWLYDNGFRGQVILTDKTCEQLKDKPLKTYILENDMAGTCISLADRLSFEFGRSGHCEGAVWYLLQLNGKRIFFSGDYCEHSAVYRCDPVRNKEAELAMIDCAYGNDEGDGGNADGDADSIDGGNHQDMFLAYISSILMTGKSVILPSPVSGRGADFLRLFYKMDNIAVVAEANLIRQLKNCDLFWNYEPAEYSENSIVTFEGEILAEQAIYILCDPQLKKAENQEFVQKFVDMGNVCVFTGHVDQGSAAEKLLKENAATSRRYYVHQNFKDVEKMVSLNQFDRVVMNHSGKKIDVGRDDGRYGRQNGVQYVDMTAGDSIEV